MTGPVPKEGEVADPKKDEPNEPALYITTQTTIPLLTTVMLTFSAVLIAIASANQFTSTPLPLPFLHLGTKDIALATLIIAALLFAFTTEACVKSQGWDYFALSEERRQFEKLPNTEKYKYRCSRRVKLWHAVAARTYNGGFFFQMLGIAFIVWPFAYFVSVVIGIYLVINTFFQILPDYAPEKVKDKVSSIGDTLADYLERKWGFRKEV